MATLFRLPEKPKETFKVNPGLKMEEVFKKLGNKRMYALICYVDQHSPWNLLRRDMADKDKLRAILKKAGFTVDGPNAQRMASYSRKILKDEDPVWLEAVERYNEIQGITSLKALEAVRVELANMLSFKVDLKNPEHQWIMKEKRMAVAQGAMSKVENEIYEVKEISKKYHTATGAGDGIFEDDEDDEIEGFDPDAA